MSRGDVVVLQMRFDDNVVKGVGSVMRMWLGC